MERAEGITKPCALFQSINDRFPGVLPKQAHDMRRADKMGRVLDLSGMRQIR